MRKRGQGKGSCTSEETKEVNTFQGFKRVVDEGKVECSPL